MGCNYIVKNDNSEKNQSLLMDDDAINELALENNFMVFV